MPAQGRLTIDANTIPELAGRDFATTFVAELGDRRRAGDVLGQPDLDWRHRGLRRNVQPSPEWHFAEGAAAPGFETFYLIQNANPTPVTVRGASCRRTATPRFATTRCRRNSRATVYLNGELGNVGGVAASFYTSPGTPVVMERSIYWGAGRVEGTATHGQSGRRLRVASPRGHDRRPVRHVPAAGEPDERLGRGRRHALHRGGRPVHRSSVDATVLPPYSRKTINMKQFLAELGAPEGVNLAGASFSTKVKVVGNTRPIVAEHAIYWQPDGANYWRGGSGGFGIPR